MEGEEQGEGHGKEVKDKDTAAPSEEVVHNNEAKKQGKICLCKASQ